MSKDGKTFYVALDAGGTMTDTFLADETGTFAIGKALTNRGDEAESYLSSVADAATFFGLTAADVHRDADFILYTGTVLLNILLTGTGEPMGLLLTRGFEHMVHQERGLVWMALSYQDRLHAQLRSHNAELVDVHHIKGITERVGGGSYYGPAHYEAGKVIIPLVEDEVRAAAEDLLDRGIRAIGILFIYSYVNPTHELRAAEIVEEVIRQRGVDAWVVPSYKVVPVARESSRLNSVIVEASAAAPARRQFDRIEAVAHAQGFKSDMLTMLGYGGTATFAYPRLHESMVSGPVGGILGAKFVGEMVGTRNLVCADGGGTSFDVGLIVDGIVGINREPDFANRRFAVPMLVIDSVDAGSGTTVRVEPTTKRILLGPESAGADVGRCFRYPSCTVSDVDVALGYLDPNNFLGGKYRLDPEKALQALTEEVANPLGADPFEIGEGILEILHSRQRDHLLSMLDARGFDPTEFTLFDYGGSGPLHLWGLADGLGMEGIVTFPWAAAFSAFGAACADHVHRLHRGLSVFVTPNMPDEFRMASGGALNGAWQELEERLASDFQAEGHDLTQVQFRAGVHARYIGQMESIAVDVPIRRIDTLADIDAVIGAFDRTYRTMYPEGARFPEAGVFVNEVFVEGVVNKVKPVIPRYPLQGRTPVEKASKGTRKVYHRGRWEDFRIWEMDHLAAGNQVQGPAIVQHPMTTLVIPPEFHVDLDEYRLIHYRKS